MERVSLDPSAIRYYSSHPVEFVEDIIRAKPDARQRDMLRSVAENPMTSVRSGHGVGKSAVESWLIIWFLATRPYPKVPCTAPTKHQLYDILWAEISKWLRNNPVLEGEIIWTQEKVFLRGYREEWFAVARTASKPDALQGFHAGHVLYIIDEASGVEDKVFEPILGALTTEGSRLFMAGNPTRLTGFFFDSHHRNRAQYNTLHIDGRESSRFDTAFIRKIVEMFGEDSDVFRVRVAGDFPKSLPDSFIPIEWAEQASGPVELPDQPRRIDIGVDVARYGDDSSVVCPVYDKARQGEPDIYHHNNITELAGRVVILVKQLARKNPGVEIHVKVDCDGLGAGVYDILQEQQDAIAEEIAKTWEAAGVEVPVVLELYECHFGGEGGTIGGESGDPIAYENSTGLMWGAVRLALYEKRLKLWENDQQISQLSNRKYVVNSRGRIELERKEAMKKRGLPSPDMADALALAMYEPKRYTWEFYGEEAQDVIFRPPVWWA